MEQSQHLPASEETYDGHYVCFVDRTHSPIKAAKNLYSVTISTRLTGGEVLWSSGEKKNQKINERPPQLLAPNSTLRNCCRIWKWNNFCSAKPMEMLFPHFKNNKNKISQKVFTKNGRKRKFWSCSDRSFSSIYYTHSSFHLIRFQIYQQDRCKLSGTIDHTIHN